MLLIVSGLMVRTFLAMRQVHPGFTRPKRSRRSGSRFRRASSATRDQAARTFESVAQRLAALPGVTSVGISSSITMDGEDNANPLHVEEFPVAPGSVPTLRRFKAWRRDTSRPWATGSPRADRSPGPRSISAPGDCRLRNARARVLGGTGKGHRQTRSRSSGQPWREIVGVTGDEHDDGVNQPATAIVYFPMLSDSYGGGRCRLRCARPAWARLAF